jgi:hypothetical protein
MLPFRATSSRQMLCISPKYLHPSPSVGDSPGCGATNSIAILVGGETSRRIVDRTGLRPRRSDRKALKKELTVARGEPMLRQADKLLFKS